MRFRASLRQRGAQTLLTLPPGPVAYVLGGCFLFLAYLLLPLILEGALSPLDFAVCTILLAWNLLFLLTQLTWHEFLFDQTAQRLTWSRKGFFKRGSGAADYSSIRSLQIKRTGSNNGVSFYALKLDDGHKEHTLTGHGDFGSYHHLVARRRQIRECLGWPQGSVEDDIREMRDAGFCLAAALHLRKTRGISFWQARREIDRL